MIRCFVSEGTDPLHTTVLGQRELVHPSTPWKSLYIASLRASVWWRPEHEPCSSFKDGPLVKTIRQLLRFVKARIQLCLACGWVGIRTRRQGGIRSGSWVEGKRWTPPCIAIKQLRNHVFRDWWTELARQRFTMQQAYQGEE